MEDWNGLGSLGQYFFGKRRFAHRHWRIDRSISLNVNTDAIWVGNTRTGESISGGSTMFGSHWVRSWSKTRGFIAMSSAELELYASAKASAEALCIQPKVRDMSIDGKALLFADASAAVGIISRRGIGKVRHQDANHLWIQEVAASQRAKFKKASGVANPADIITNDFPRIDIDEHVKAMSVLCRKSGRGCTPRRR